MNGTAFFILYKMLRLDLLCNEHPRKTNLDKVGG